MAKIKQPTASEFTKRQASWAAFIQKKIQKKIKEREAYLRSINWSEDEFSDDVKLMDLYDDELFYNRYEEEMNRQREYIRDKYLRGVKPKVESFNFDDIEMDCE